MAKMQLGLEKGAKMLEFHYNSTRKPKAIFKEGCTTTTVASQDNSYVVTILAVCSNHFKWGLIFSKRVGTRDRFTTMMLRNNLKQLLHTTRKHYSDNITSILGYFVDP
eukprot:TRINITY_DN87923_c0_g1_i1.p1 TRINITY_DN87923_c0_g1~~TRINITY_DN87923_c0_g1_i1.p1  ORF type:complete len:124 (-),score=2.34 TRINITY_DN87923_c0_g1_i1:28-351(-)